MERAFLTRGPQPNELTLLKKYLGSYRDGSGNNRESDGTSRADSRQIERCLAELLHGRTTESKAFYDFVVESNESGGIAVRGASVKSKELTKLLDYKKPASRAVMRSHLEISNASAKDWALCREFGLTEEDFRDHKKASEFGRVILLRQTRELQASEQSYIQAGGNANKFFYSNDCVFISVLYSPPVKGERSWLVSSFSVILPEPAKWLFSGSRVIGQDADGGVLYEWYALSGSQFKYYPKISNRLHGTDLFEISSPAVETLRAKSSRLFGD
jgi:phage anti-repressor protein